MNLYTLNDLKQPVVCEDVIEWAKWFEKAERHVEFTTFTFEGREWKISTVFLGVDHNFHADGPPILFETMVFVEGWVDTHMDRYATWRDAKSGHARMVSLALKGALSERFKKISE